MTAEELESGFFDAEGVWCQAYKSSGSKHPRPALFLDRDGVIVEEVIYLHRASDVALISGAANAIAGANRRGIPVVMISNQAGIGRGCYGWNDYYEVQRTMTEQLHRLGARIDGAFSCPHHPEGIGGYRHADHPARKPRAGMLLRAAELMHIDLRNSWIIGDKASDLAAGREAGLPGGVLVLTGHGPSHRETACALRTLEFAVLVANSIGEATQFIPLLA